MKSRTGPIIIIIIVIVLLIIAAAAFMLRRGSSSEQAVDIQTQPTATPITGLSSSPTSVKLQNTPLPPAVVATATPLPTPLTGTLLGDMNLRAGPGTEYSRMGGLKADAEVTIVGRNEDGSWLMIEFEDGTAWVSGDPAYVSIDTALLEGVPVVQDTGEATVTYDSNNESVNNVLNKIPLVIHHPNTFTCASHAGLNNLEGVQAGNVIGPHSGDFVHTDLGNVLFKYGNGTVRLIRENPIARFEGDAESLPLDQALQMFETGVIVWTGEFGEQPARGVTGCDESAGS